MLYTIILVSSVVLLFIIFLLKKTSIWRFRRPNEPPLDRGLVPWFGHVVDFNTNTYELLCELKKKHGDIFTLQAAGSFITVLLDPHVYEEVLLKSDKFDFRRYEEALLKIMFDVSLPYCDLEVRRLLMRESFKEKYLRSLTRTFLYYLRVMLLNDKIEGKWNESSLFDFSCSNVFSASYLTLFGGNTFIDDDQIESLVVYEYFTKLDRLVVKYFKDILDVEEKEVFLAARKELWDLLSIKKINSRVKKSCWLINYKQYLEDMKVSDEMQSKIMVAQLWSMHCNVGPTVFWVLVYILKNPDVMKEIKKEMTAAFACTKESRMSYQAMLDSTPVFDSVIEETLRLTAAPIITREIVSETTITLSNQNKYSLRGGDTLCIFPYISPQMDPEVYEDVDTFNHKRFIDENNNKITEFYKNGKKLKHFTAPWGLGLHKCIGKHFGLNIVKQFIFIVLTYFEIELKHPNVRVPGRDLERCGFGLLHPDEDVTLRYKRKVSA
ncbi:ORF-135 [Teiidae poxvirus 1]|nr:ORF-135 [Teiidae poxvirus 1]